MLIFLWPVELTGHFFGMPGYELKDVPISLSCIPEEARDNYANYKCRQSIASIEQLLKDTDKNTFTISTGELVSVLGNNVYQDYNCVQVKAKFNKTRLIELVNSVRNRISDFNIAIQKEDSNVGNAQFGIDSNIKPTKVTQIFNTTISGGTANIIGIANDSKISIDIINNDFASLEKALLGNAILKEDISKLKVAINEDPSPTTKGIFGPCVSKWIGKMIKKSAEGIWNIGINVAGGILAQSISKYYGFN